MPRDSYFIYIDAHIGHAAGTAFVINVSLPRHDVLLLARDASQEVLKIIHTYQALLAHPTPDQPMRLLVYYVKAVPIV